MGNRRVTLLEILDNYNLNWWRNADQTIEEASKHPGTDKESSHKYVSSYYEKAFAPYKEKPDVKIMEIGVQDGASLILWNFYFKYGEVYGVDPYPKWRDPRVSRQWTSFRSPKQDRDIDTNIKGYIQASVFGTTRWLDWCQYINITDNIVFIKKDAYGSLYTNFANEFFDIIIDDGTHQTEDLRFVIDHYWSKLKVGGLLVLEDLIEDQRHYITGYIKSLYGNSAEVKEINTSENAVMKHNSSIVSAYKREQ